MALDGAHLVVGDVTNFLSTLQSLGTGSKVCILSFAQSGFSARWEDGSKALQSSLSMRPQAFSEYYCHGRDYTFGVQYNVLLEALNGFSLTCSAPLHVRYSERNLTMEMKETEHSDDVSLYMRIQTLEVNIPIDLLDFFTEPSSFFLMPGVIMKEVLHDLEWAQKNAVTITMQREPKMITCISESHGGAVQIDIPPEELSGFHCHEESVSYQYSLKLLKIAFASVDKHKGSERTTMTKVVVDSQGLFKATHILEIGEALNAASSGAADVNNPLDGHRRPKVQFAILPLDEDIEMLEET